MTTDQHQAPEAMTDEPPLPNPAHRGPDGTGAYFDSYTADQMRAYALAALSSQPSPELAGMSDEEIRCLGQRNAWHYKYSSDPAHSSTYKFNDACLLQFARAILALRPAQPAAPMTDEQVKAARRSVCDDPDELPEPWAFRMGIRAAEAHHGITAQGAQEGV